MNKIKTETFEEMIDAFLREGGTLREVSFDAETGFTANVWIHGDKEGRGATWQEAVCDAIETQLSHNKMQVIDVTARIIVTVYHDGSSTVQHVPPDATKVIVDGNVIYDNIELDPKHSNYLGDCHGMALLTDRFIQEIKESERLNQLRNCEQTKD